MSIKYIIHSAQKIARLDAWEFLSIRIDVGFSITQMHAAVEKLNKIVSLHCGSTVFLEDGKVWIQGERDAQNSTKNSPRVEVTSEWLYVHHCKIGATFERTHDEREFKRLYGMTRAECEAVQKATGKYPRCIA